MTLHAWMDHNAGSPSRLSADTVEPDSLSTTIRMALDARKIGLSPERTEELMLQAGYGIEVVESPGIGNAHCDDPRSVRQRLIDLQDRTDTFELTVPFTPPTKRATPYPAMAGCASPTALSGSGAGGVLYSQEHV